jgi:hypothetical protein
MLDWFHLPWKSEYIEDLDGLESRLEAAFQLVEPSPEYVHDLRRRLVTFPVSITPDPDSKVPQYIALTIASLLSGVAVVGFGIWIVLALIGRLQSNGKNAASSPQTLM